MTDAEAILSVWKLIKVGGTWGAPGPPPWIVDKTSEHAGTLTFGNLDKQCIAAFHDAGIIIKEARS